MPFMCDVDNLNILGNDPGVQNSRLLEGQYVFSIDGEHATPKNIGKQPRCIKLSPWLQVSQRKCQKFGISTFSQTCHFQFHVLNWKCFWKSTHLDEFRPNLDILCINFAQHFKPIITNSEITLSVKRTPKTTFPEVPSFFEVGSPMIVCPCHRNDFANAKCAEKLLVFVKTRRISLKPLFLKGHGFVYFVVRLKDEGSMQEIVETEL